MNDRVWTSSEVPATAPGSAGARRSPVSVGSRGDRALRYHPIRCPHSSPAPFAGRSTWVGNAGRHRTYCAGAGRHYLIGRYYDPTTGQFLCVDPDVRDSGVGYAYADDNPVSDSDPTGQAARFINPYGCGVYVGNAHWQNGQRATNTVKVNASILNCREEPEWGIITVILWKVGFLDEDNHNEEMTTVTSTESAFHYQKPSAGGWQMSNQKTLIKGRRVDGVSSTFFGQVVYAAVVEGGIKYDTSDVERPIRSAANWTADDFWTGK